MSADKPKPRGKPFPAGNPGRVAGTPNKLTRTVKETVLAVFNQLQSDRTHNLLEFGKKNPKEFYLIASKLIPTEVKNEIYMPEGIKIEFTNDPGCKPIDSESLKETPKENLADLLTNVSGIEAIAPNR